MRFDIACHYSSELRRKVALALPTDRTDAYLEQFRSSLPFPPIIKFLLENRLGITHFVDVGANVGHVTVHAAALDLECLAIEPEPFNYVLLCETLLANGFTNAHAVHAAASDTPGVLELVGDSAWAKVAGDTEQVTSGVVVPALPLDDMLPPHGFGAPDLIKIDVEGHEAAVIRGLRRTIEYSRPLLIVESNTWTLGGVGRARKLLATLEGMNYLLYLFMDDGSVVRRISSELQPTAVVDYLAVPADETDARALPEVRAHSFEEELRMMAAEPLDSKPHALHLCHVIVSLEREGAEGLAALEQLKEGILTGDPDVTSFVRRNYPAPLPAWLIE